MVRVGGIGRGFVEIVPQYDASGTVETSRNFCSPCISPCEHLLYLFLSKKGAKCLNIYREYQ